MSNKFYHRELTVKNLLKILEHVASKLEKIGQFFLKFQSISIHAIRSDRQFQYQSSITKLDH